MIIFNQETRQFSVIDETREFGALSFAGNIIRRAQRGRNISNIIKASTGRRTQKDQKRSDKMLHKERMAMIKMGMDPTALESESLQERRLRNEDRADRRAAKYGHKTTAADRALEVRKLDQDHAYKMKQLESAK